MFSFSECCEAQVETSFFINVIFNKKVDFLFITKTQLLFRDSLAVKRNSFWICVYMWWFFIEGPSQCFRRGVCGMAGSLYSFKMNFILYVKSFQFIFLWLGRCSMTCLILSFANSIKGHSQGVKKNQTL